MSRYVALLRGMNLGARRRVPMQELRAALEHAGYEDVRTLLRSGNVVLTSDADPAALERELAATLHTAFGFEVAVLVRTRDESPRSSPATRSPAWPTTPRATR